MTKSFYNSCDVCGCEEVVLRGERVYCKECGRNAKATTWNYFNIGIKNKGGRKK
jgi:hypothetical protein